MHKNKTVSESIKWIEREREGKKRESRRRQDKARGKQKDIRVKWSSERAVLHLHDNEEVEDKNKGGEEGSRHFIAR